MAWPGDPADVLAWQSTTTAPGTRSWPTGTTTGTSCWPAPPTASTSGRCRWPRGETFASVTATVAVTADRDTALAVLTRHRRTIRRPHRDNAELRVVFNDFMNCLMGDPGISALLPLVTAAAAVGAE